MSQHVPACPYCGGSGRLVQVSYGAFGGEHELACSACSGAGRGARCAYCVEYAVEFVDDEGVLVCASHLDALREGGAAPSASVAVAHESALPPANDSLHTELASSLLLLEDCKARGLPYKDTLAVVRRAIARTRGAA